MKSEETFISYNHHMESEKKWQEINVVPDDVKSPYDGKCWWCGTEANSKEHKFKRSDLRREFGPGPWKNENSVLWGVGRGERLQQVSGPNARPLKFKNSICRDCNNERSQKFDYAYEKFTKYLRLNLGTLPNGIVSLPRVFGEKWREELKNTTKYFVKHISCRLAEDDIRVPESFVKFLNGESAIPAGLTLTLVVHRDVTAVEKHSREVHGDELGYLSIGDSRCTYSYSRREIETVSSSLGFGSISVFYDIDYRGSGFKGNFQTKKIRPDYQQAIDPGSVADYCLECNPGSGVPGGK